MDDKERDVGAREAAVAELRAKNGNLIYRGWPAEVLELLDDPRLDGMVEGPKGIPTIRVLQPSDINRADSKYLKITDSFEAQPGENAEWVNEPRRLLFRNGNGLGFDHIEDRPRIEQPKTPPKKLFHLWEYRGFFVASPDMLELLRQACPEAISSIPIDWVFSDGQALDRYEFMDVIAIRSAYDYRRSVVKVELKDGRKCPSLGYDRTLRDDIPASARLFRDAHYSHDVFISRDLATQVARLARRELRFEDVQTHRSIEFASVRAPRSLKARLKKDQWPSDDASIPLERRVGMRVIPLLRSGRFVAAEALLADWLRAVPVTSFHPILNLAITTPLEHCAEFFNEFCTKARREHPLKALYSEMNGFAINTDLWFCGAYGFAFDGGEDGHDWLGNFGACTEESLVITGLEPVQQAFDEWMAPETRSREEATAKWLAEALVIVKFQGWLQRSLTRMKKSPRAFWATAHDHYQYLGKIVPRKESAARVTGTGSPAMDAGAVMLDDSATESTPDGLVPKILDVPR